MDMENDFQTKYVSSSDVFVTEEDQPENESNQPDEDTKAIFIDQANLSPSQCSETLKRDPLDASPSCRFKQEQDFSKTFTDNWEPLPQVVSNEICLEKPLLVQYRSSLVQSNKATDSSNSSRQFSATKILLTQSTLKTNIDNRVTRLLNPKCYSRRSKLTDVSEQKFMDQISLARTDQRKVSSDSATLTTELPTIVSLISVKKSPMKQTLPMKNVSPKCSLLRNTPGKNNQKQQVTAKKNVQKKEPKPIKVPQISQKKTLPKKEVLKKCHKQKSLVPKVLLKKIAPKRDPKPKKVLLKKHLKTEISSNEDSSTKNTPKKVSPKKASPQKTRKPQQPQKSKDSLPKALKPIPQAEKPEDITVSLAVTEVPRTVACSECDKMFISYRGLARHFRCHKKPLLYTCDVCSKTFKKRSNMLSHASVHSKEGRFACSVCPAKFAWRNTLNTHILSHEDRLYDPLRCLVCKEKFWYQKTWDQHVSKGQCRKKDKICGRTLYKCDICQSVKTTRGNLKRHIQMHQGLKPFVCEICGALFTAQASLNDHVNRHNGKRSFVCHICGKSFTQASGFRQHVATHNQPDQFVCKLCKKGFKLNRYLVRHMDTMHACETKFNCHLCGKLFKLGDYLRRHMRAVHHNVVKVANMNPTRKPTTESNDFEDHEAADKLCGLLEDNLQAEDSLELMDFKQNETIDDTNVNESEEIVKQEPLCIENYEGELVEIVTSEVEVVESTVSEFNNVEVGDRKAREKLEERGNEALQMYEVLFEEGNEDDTAIPILEVSAQNEIDVKEVDNIFPVKNRRVRRKIVRPFGCPVCTKSFNKQKTLDLHMESHSVDRPLECDICRYRFKTKQAVRRHLQSHGAKTTEELECADCGKIFLRETDRKRHVCDFLRTFKCRQCDAVFNQPTLLYKHVKEQHQASLECNVCGKLSTTVSNLKKHMLVHTGEKPFVCEICGARFTANQSLKMHVGTHEGQRPFVCSICAKTFTQKSCLTQHEMLHDQEPRYPCPHCDKKFKVVSYLRRHIAVLHTTEKRFACADCGKRYGLRSALAIHELSHRERRRFQCEVCDKTFSDKRYMTKHAMKEHEMDL